MREEIRLGNEALAQNDIETAKRHFEQLLANGGTVTQERIATNRLRDIQEKQEAINKPSTPKRRARRKSPDRAEGHDEPRRTFVRPPEKPLVIIHKH